MDREKALDRVEHSVLWDVLQQFGFGNNFRNWVKLLYNGAVSRMKWPADGKRTDGKVS